LTKKRHKVFSSLKTASTNQILIYKHLCTADHNRGGVGSGMRGYRKPAVEDDKGQAERLADNTGNDDPASGGSGSEWDGFILSGSTI
jgi:hypothetical protein